MLWEGKFGRNRRIDEMTTESAFIAMMRQIATGTAARGLTDDAAVIELGNDAIVITHDIMSEGIHWLPNADPADIAWKLVSVNLSDLAAKGALPLGVMLGFMLGDEAWDRKFAAGLDYVLAHYNVPLLGGDTVSSAGDKRSLGMTAIGQAIHKPVPTRSGAQAGDILYVTGTLGNALAGFEFAEAGLHGPAVLMDAYHKPAALLSEGQALSRHVNAVMDISDGLLLDASRMALASGLALKIDLASLPLSVDYIACRGETIESRLQAASWGDDYQLLFAASRSVTSPVAATAIGEFGEGGGLYLFDQQGSIPLPLTLGYQHG
jgi:thiamine-monophosphate kinase